MSVNLNGLVEEIVEQKISSTVEELTKKWEELNNKINSIRDQPNSTFLSKRQLAERLDCTERHIQNLTKDGRLLPHRYGGRVGYFWDEVEVFLRNN